LTAFRDQELIDRIQGALALDHTNRAQLKKRTRIRERLKYLTLREREVLALVTRGRSNKVMVGDLGISGTTRA
jgi:FixJ family two-component response regulator